MKRSSIRQNKFIGIGTILILVIVWQIVAMWVGNDFTVPTPYHTALELGRLVQSQVFYQSIGMTVLRTLIAFFISFGVSLLLGSLSYRYQVVEASLRPIVTILRSVPTLAIILILLLWISRDIVPVVISFLILFPIMYQNVLTSMKETSVKYLEMAKVYHLSSFSIIKNIYLPSMRPYLKSSALAGLTLGLKVVVAGEVMGMPKLGIGARMALEKMQWNNAGLFAWAIITITIAVLLNYVVERVR